MNSYPEDMGERGKDVKYDGELRLDIKEIALHSDVERSEIAWVGSAGMIRGCGHCADIEVQNLGMYAAIGIVGVGQENVCSDVDTTRYVFSGRGQVRTIKSELRTCFIPRDFVLQITDPTQGPNELNTMFVSRHARRSIVKAG